MMRNLTDKTAGSLCKYGWLKNGVSVRPARRPQSEPIVEIEAV